MGEGIAGNRAGCSASTQAGSCWGKSTRTAPADSSYMKPLLFLSLLVAWPLAGFSETYYRHDRHVAPVIERSTTTRTITTTTSPSYDVYRDWDRGHDYVWGSRRYHWDGGAWIVLPGGATAPFAASATLQDDVGDNIPDEVYVAPRVTRVEVAGTGLAFDVQRRLARRGYYHGPIDGIVGPGTRSAIAAFQADNGQEANGVMTHEVVTTLGL